MKKKILAGLLALCMIFSMVPMSAFAADGDNPADNSSKVSTALLADHRASGNGTVYSQTQLNTGCTVTAEKDTTATSLDGVTAIYNVTVTHPALLKHYNSKKKAGLWIGVGVPHTVDGTAKKSSPAGQNGDGSAFYAFSQTKNTTLENVVKHIKSKTGFGNNATPGFVEWGWRQKNENGNTNVYYNLAEGKGEVDYYLAERNPVESKTDQFTYILYKIDFSAVKEGHLVTIEKPTNGTLTVKNGTTEVETGTPVAVGTELTITVTPDKGHKVKNVKVGDTVLTAKDGTYTTKVTTEDITISAEFEGIPTIEKAGFAWDAADANTNFGKDIDAVRGTNAGYAKKDADDQSMWMVCSGLEDGKYTFKVTSAGVTEPYFTGAVEVTNATQPKPAWIWSPLDGGNASQKSFPNEARTYTISLYKGENPAAEAKAVATKTVNVTPFTAPTATATLRADKKTLNVALSKTLRGEYKVELLNAQGAAAGTAVEKFFDGTSKDIVFNNAAEYAKGTYTVKVSTMLGLRAEGPGAWNAVRFIHPCLESGPPTPALFISPEVVEVSLTYPEQ